MKPEFQIAGQRCKVI